MDAYDQTRCPTDRSAGPLNPWKQMEPVETNGACGKTRGKTSSTRGENETSLLCGQCLLVVSVGLMSGVGSVLFTQGVGRRGHAKERGGGGEGGPGPPFVVIGEKSGGG